MNKINFLSFFICLFLPIILFGQEIRQNEIGERIIVFPNGTWRYFHKRQLSGDNYPVVNKEVTPLDNPIEITREEVYQLVNRRIQQAKDAMYYADIRAKAMAEQEKELQNKIADAQKNSLVPADELNKLFNQLTLTKQLASNSLGTIKEAQSDLLITQDLKMKGDILRLFKPEVSPGKLELSTVFASEEMVNLDFFANDSPLAFYKQNIGTNLPDYLVSASSICQYTYEGLDAKGLDWRRDGEKELLFTFTDERLKLFFPDKEYLRCEAFLSSVGKREKQLTIEFRFSYPNAREAYGVIEKNSLITLKLFDGQILELKAGELDLGKYETDKDILTYRMIYKIDNQQINLLRKQELEEIRMYWSAGFEVYPVYNIDFFSRQLKCLD
ncbi:MAG: hypothetical protein K9I02_07555 [Haliscomenobacter sp.]|nr:hypothetical protein [Haliscomenobacter sp.]MCF8318589.1 hypothetical protein [Haliscomenobacter sp.]